MKKCPFCAETIEDNVTKCPFCGESLDGGPRIIQGAGYAGYEYKTKARWFGLPLIHIAAGIDPETGRKRIAKGIIAIGNVAKGVIAIGGIAVGGITIGGISLGVLAFGGISFGIVALGILLAFAVFLAAGILAISPFYAIGVLAFARNSIGVNGVDQWFLRQLEKWWTIIGP
jgi:hypothetical protein